MMAYKYRFLFLLRQKVLLFWDLLFPILMGTLFFVAFSNINKSTESFSVIPVAVVKEGGSESYFLDTLEEVSKGDNAIIDPEYVSVEEAEKLLSEGEVDGIYHVGDKIRLTVSEDGLNQSILKIISDSFLQASSTISNIAEINPLLVEQVISDITDDLNINREITLGRGETDNFINYYYALIAMTCLFGCFFGYYNAYGIQANMSPLGARRSVAPTKKLYSILWDFAAAVTVSILLVSVFLMYLAFVLRVNLGDNLGLVILTSLVGCFAGVAYGTVVGAVSGVFGLSENLSTGFMVGFTLLMCFMSGLMNGNMKNLIEHSVPVLNRINPAALISDAFYCLTAFEDYSRYTRAILLLLVISALCCIVSAVIVRRKRYASI